MTTIFASKALTADGWAERVRISTADGRISGLETGGHAEEGDVVAGIVIPGIANAHSHAFQRALSGHTERRGPDAKDNFWSWRSRMYQLAGDIDPPALQAIARQAYTEMVSCGYTSVAEFHYLHNPPGVSEPTMDMLEAIARAATDAGIRLTYVPVLYERAGFDASGPEGHQRRFATSLDAFLAHYRAAARHAGDLIAVGIGAHSLRAVFPESLARIAEVAATDAVPMHLHIAEQRREVDQCLAAYGQRPVRWLLANHEPGAHWCLVHATHMDDEEIEALAATDAVVCLCPSTEANLGDGLFPLQRWLEHGGRIAIGSDSHVSINPFEELRWLEYGQRLKFERRNVAAIGQAHTGRSLFEQAVAGGRAAIGQGSGRLEPSAPADLVVLDDDSPMLVGHRAESILDALVFSGFTLPIDRVMVGGEWQVIEGRHRNERASREAFAAAVRRLTEADRR